MIFMSKMSYELWLDPNCLTHLPHLCGENDDPYAELANEGNLRQTNFINQARDIAYGSWMGTTKDV